MLQKCCLGRLTLRDAITVAAMIPEVRVIAALATGKFELVSWLLVGSIQATEVKIIHSITNLSGKKPAGTMGGIGVGYAYFEIL